MFANSEQSQGRRQTQGSVQQQVAEEQNDANTTTVVGYFDAGEDGHTSVIVRTDENAINAHQLASTHCTTPTVYSPYYNYTAANGYNFPFLIDGWGHLLQQPSPADSTSSVSVSGPLQSPIINNPTLSNFDTSRLNPLAQPFVNYTQCRPYLPNDFTPTPSMVAFDNPKKSGRRPREQSYAKASSVGRVSFFPSIILHSVSQLPDTRFLFSSSSNPLLPFAFLNSPSGKCERAAQIFGILARGRVQWNESEAKFDKISTLTESEQTDKIDMDDEDSDKKLKRRQRNKEAAARCRQRRLDLMTSLQEQVDKYREENNKKEEEIRLIKIKVCLLNSSLIVNEVCFQFERMQAFLLNHDCKMTADERNALPFVQFLTNVSNASLPQSSTANSVTSSASLERTRAKSKKFTKKSRTQFYDFQCQNSSQSRLN
ncbi:hypothetical protein WR25_27043 isoform B [Diploscapter pachys]|uniref:BZIP domain-containing protein n=1 Tax=Diploscapter pachys TaxID=2018661 RepID=A0A2A2KCM4_9BILA|nr:hypothetical protein WR25_27043 isoform B [Diploscapter pachys]